MLIYTGFGLVESSKITNWKVVKGGNQHINVEALKDEKAIFKLSQSNEKFQDENISRYFGLFYEAIGYVLKDSEQTGKPCHAWRMLQLGEMMTVLLLDQPEEESSINDLDSLKRTILSSSEGTYVTFDEVKGFFTRVEACIMLDTMVPPSPNARIWLHGSNGTVTELAYLA
ncbi:MAG: hypothetical protein H9W81_13705 [Enterococcus sp.]|nr:hypothetical protein [Enterococcus sp.]